MLNLKYLIDLFIHLDVHLASLINILGSWSYVMLFLIIFAETGLVVTPFLPGDSLLFAAGALAGGGYLNVMIIYFLMLAAAILGDSANYWIGQKFGRKLFSNKESKIFKQEYLKQTEEFYEKYGSKAIIIARFVPIVRTFAPFVAGIGNMHYDRFISYNVIGGFIWVTALVFAGYFFGGLEIVQKNFEIVVLAIIFLSVLPAIFEYAKHHVAKNKAKTLAE
ncbi:MAG: hypothetical protein COY80_04565 [Candidatus Pacebacteria bacterium CG_4_10_14_0_8_um_filter_42_14]|nr:MAG: hypothetical protein COY80_04565 [Candidatus Pacebacteria bacterium CG_4_10_14_0_8_um_filter_42_14]